MGKYLFYIGVSDTYVPGTSNESVPFPEVSLHHEGGEESLDETQIPIGEAARRVRPPTMCVRVPEEPELLRLFWNPTT